MGNSGKVVSGTIWTTIASLVQAVIQILKLSILTRFLDKSDFGLIAIIVLVIGFTNIFADLGISVALFSKKDISKKEYSSLYWVSIILSIGLYIAVSIAAPLVATFYKLPELKILIPIMALDLIIATVGRQFRILSQKQLKFKQLSVIEIISASVSISVSFYLASNHYGVWSLVYSNLCASLITSFLLVVIGIRSHPIILYLNIREGKPFYKIGIYQTGSQILDYLAGQLDILIIGKLMGPSELGIYNLIKQLVMRLYGLINPIVMKIAIPTLVQFNDNFFLLKKKYIDLLKLIAFLNFTIYSLLALVSKEVLVIIYGPEYQEYYFILQILCLWGAIMSVMSAASSIVSVTGRTNIGFRWTIVRIIINPLFIIIGSYFGFLGIVLGQAIYIIMIYGFYWNIVINKILNTVTLKQYISIGVAALVKSCSILLIATFFKHYTENYLSNVFVALIFYSLIYLVAVLLIQRNFVKEIRSKMK